MKKIINEQIGYDKFIDKMLGSYPESKEFINFINDIINKSNCNRIEFTDFSMPANGASLYDRVLINNDILKSNLTYFLYVLFHELAHQYQYKKYGINKMYGIYTGDVTVNQGAIFMKNVEDVADEFAIRKLREMKNKYNNITLNVKQIRKNYENTPISQFEKLIEYFIFLINRENIIDKVEISEILYNNIKKG